MTESEQLTDLQKENAQLKAELKKVCLRTIDFNIYNSQLKELLEDCRLELDSDDKQQKILIDKIKEVLGDR
jgi:hypothetical protein